MAEFSGGDNGGSDQPTLQNGERAEQLARSLGVLGYQKEIKDLLDTGFKESELTTKLREMGLMEGEPADYSDMVEAEKPEPEANPTEEDELETSDEKIAEPEPIEDLMEEESDTGQHQVTEEALSELNEDPKLFLKSLRKAIATAIRTYNESVAEIRASIGKESVDSKAPEEPDKSKMFDVTLMFATARHFISGKDGTLNGGTNGYDHFKEELAEVRKDWKEFMDFLRKQENQRFPGPPKRYEPKPKG